MFPSLKQQDVNNKIRNTHRGMDYDSFKTIDLPLGAGLVSGPTGRAGLSRSRPHHDDLTVRAEYAGARPPIRGRGAGRRHSVINFTEALCGASW